MVERREGRFTLSLSPPDSLGCSKYYTGLRKLAAFVTAVFSLPFRLSLSQVLLLLQLISDYAGVHISRALHCTSRSLSGEICTHSDTFSVPAVLSTQCKCGETAAKLV